MLITIVAATEIEILPSIRYLSGQGFDIHENKFQLLISGVGMLASSYALTKHLMLQKPQMLIQAGIAGSYTNELPLVSTVIIKEECIGDQGVEESGDFKDIFDLELGEKDNFPFKGKKLINPDSANWEKKGYQLARAVTINEISTNNKRIEQLKTKYQPEIESMEGAAFHYICLQEKIPFVQIRAVSNYVGERNKKNWKLPESIAALNDSLINLIQHEI